MVQKYISSVFTKLGWHEEQVWRVFSHRCRVLKAQTPFEGETPEGRIAFNNLIYTFDPDAPRKVVLSAHFDSKWFSTFPANQVR